MELDLTDTLKHLNKELESRYSVEGEPGHDCGEAAGYLFYVMPLVEGESLRDRLLRDGSDERVAPQLSTGIFMRGVA